MLIILNYFISFFLFVIYFFELLPPILQQYKEARVYVSDSTKNNSRRPGHFAMAIFHLISWIIY